MSERAEILKVVVSLQDKDGNTVNAFSTQLFPRRAMEELYKTLELIAMSMPRGVSIAELINRERAIRRWFRE